MMKSILLTIGSAMLSTLAFAQKDSSAIYFAKGLDEKKAGRWMVAGKHFDKAVAFNPKFTDAWLENGKVNLEMRRINEANLAFAKAYEIDPNNPVAAKELSTLYFNNRQFAKAIEVASKCKSCPDGDRIIGMSHYQQEDYGKAIPYLQKAVAKDVQDAEAIYMLARTYLDMEEYKNATVWYEKAVALPNAKATWFYELGLIYYNVENFKAAQKYFEAAGEKGYQKSMDYYENLGYAYLHDGNFDNGVKYLNMVIEKKPGNGEVMSDLALAYYNKKQYDNALNWYQKLLEKNMRDAKALYMAGLCFQKKGDKDRGQAMCDKAIEMDPSLSSKRSKMMSAGL